MRRREGIVLGVERQERHLYKVRALIHAGRRVVLAP